MMPARQSRQASSVEQPLRWPLVQQLYTRSPDTPITKDARLVNGYAEKDPQGGDYWIYKRLGISPTPVYNGPAGFPGGTYYVTQTGVVLTVANSTVWVGNVNIGSIANPNGFSQCWFETVNWVGNSKTVVIQNPFAAWLYNTNTNALVQITDPSYPVSTCPGLAYLDGTLYVMDYSGNIWGTASLNNPAVWSGLNVIPASTKGDAGVFIATQLTYVIAFKQWTTQIFYDAEAPAPGSPLLPVPDAQIPYGCLHPNSVQKIDEILLWMTSNQTISPQIILMENLSPRIVSTPSVERILDNIIVSISSLVVIANDTSLFCWVLKHAGHRFYGLTCPPLNITLVYDIDQKLWYIWTDANGNYWPMGNFTYTLPSKGIPGLTQDVVGLHLAQVVSNANSNLTQGQVYQVDGDYEFPNDAGYLYPVDIYTPNFTAGTLRRKTLNMMYFESDQTPGSLLNCRYSDDDYRSWSNFRTVDLNYERPYLDQEGTFTRRAYHFRHRCNTTFRIRASNLQIDVGSL